MQDKLTPSAAQKKQQSMKLAHMNSEYSKASSPAMHPGKCRVFQERHVPSLQSTNVCFAVRQLSNSLRWETLRYGVEQCRLTHNSTEFVILGEQLGLEQYLYVRVRGLAAQPKYPAAIEVQLEPRE